MYIHRYRFPKTSYKIIIILTKQNFLPLFCTLLYQSAWKLFRFVGQWSRRKHKTRKREATRSWRVPGEKEWRVELKFAPWPTRSMRVIAFQKLLTILRLSFNLKAENNVWPKVLFQFKCVNGRHYVHIILIWDVLCEEKWKESHFLFLRP